MKKFKRALVVGRFNNFHVGHKSLVDLALTLAEKVYVFVGSSQEKGTERNPFSANTRIRCIEAVYGDKVSVRPLPDLTDENDITPEWGRYVLEHFIVAAGDKPDLMVYGNDEERSGWFAKEDKKDMSELAVSREGIFISATAMRTMLKHNKKLLWMSYTPVEMYPLYDTLREELLAVPHYQV